MQRLTDSLYLGYYVEAITLEYAIMEDRLTSVLKHSHSFDEKKHRSLNKKINEIKSINKKENSQTKEYISNEILDLINAWGAERYKIVRNLMNKIYDSETIREMAVLGQEIVKILNNKTTCLNKKMDKINNLQVA